jgi:hypothetical protein
MRRLFPALALLLAACNPTFNWRDIHLGDTGLDALLPCKPDQAQRSVPLAGRQVELQMLGCEAGGATFAVAVAPMGEAGLAATALAQWQAATLANMHAGAPQAQPLSVPGADARPPAVRLSASGRRADGGAVVAQAAWFVRGTRVFHAVMYADKPDPAVAETFFSGLRFP